MSGFQRAFAFVCFCLFFLDRITDRKFGLKSLCKHKIVELSEGLPTSVKHLTRNLINKGAKGHTKRISSR